MNPENDFNTETWKILKHIIFNSIHVGYLVLSLIKKITKKSSYLLHWNGQDDSATRKRKEKQGDIRAQIYQSMFTCEDQGYDVHFIRSLNGDHAQHNSYLSQS